MRLLLFCGCVVCLFVCGFLLIRYAVSSINNSKNNTQLAALYYEAPSETPVVTPSPAPSTEAPVSQKSVQPTLAPSYQRIGPLLSSSQKLYNKNRDFVAWLNIEGVVDLPIVYRDNEYYLRHDFNGKESSAGTLFLDELTPLSPQTQYLLVHGHNMHDGSMFALLNHYDKLKYVTGHGIAHLNTLYWKETYALFAVAIVELNPASDAYIPYYGFSYFTSEAAFNSFMSKVEERSLFNIPIDVDPSDAILALSTCKEEDRIVAFFRRVRPGETETELQELLLQSTKK